MTTDNQLRAMAEAAGIATTWRDVHGRDQTVGPDTLRAVTAAQGLPEDAAAARETLHHRPDDAARAAPDARPEQLLKASLLCPEPLEEARRARATRPDGSS